MTVDDDENASIDPLEGSNARTRAVNAALAAARRASPTAPPGFAPPSDGTPCWRVADLELGLTENSTIYICEHSGTFEVDLQAHPVRYDKRRHGKIIDPDYSAEHPIQLRATLTGVHAHGMATGHFKLGESSAAGHVGIHLSEFVYDLELKGELTLRDGWLGINGNLKQMVGRHEFPFQLYFPIDSPSLQWQHYLFSSLEEARGAAPSQVRKLSIMDPDFEQFPEALLAFKELRDLTIAMADVTYPYDRNPPGRLQRLPEDLSVFPELRSLSIRYASIEEIPASVARLEYLERVSIAYCPALKTSQALLQHPTIEHLSIMGCGLRHLPEQAGAPRLISLNLERNQLRHLPDAIVELPKLRWLYLEQNPWQSLPGGVLEVEHLQLELEVKRALLSFDYPGAGGIGVVPFDDEVFALDRRSAQYSALHANIMAHDLLAAHATELLALARNALQLTTTTADDYSMRGNTRVGGLPDLPIGMPYPTFEYREQARAMRFVAQLNCAELAPYQDYLPRSGTLYFFIVSIEFDECKVVHHDGDDSDLRSGKELDTDSFAYWDDWAEEYVAHRVDVRQRASVPYFYCDDHYYSAQLGAQLEDDAELEDSLHEFRTAWDGGEGDTNLAINSYVFSQNDVPEVRAAGKLRGNPHDWMVLLKVPSDGKAGFMWSDSGEIFFLIHKSDLARRVFSNVYLSSESS